MSWEERRKNPQKCKRGNFILNLGHWLTLQRSPPIALKIDDITGRTSEKALRTWGWPYSRFVSLVNTLRGSPAIVLKSDDILGAESKKTFER